MTISDNSSHYKGLLTTWYDTLIGGEKEDIRFYKEIMQNSQCPALELACGTGRILVELLEDGYVIDGLDSSQDMLEVCQQKIDKLGYESKLYCQKIQELELERKYKTIIIAGGSFQLIDEFGDAAEALKRIYNALEYGGKLVLDLFIPWDEIISNQEGIWKLGRIGSNDDDNTRFVVHVANTFDLKNQIIDMATKYELYHQKQLIKTEYDNVKLRWYTINEFSLLLEKFGFGEISAKQKNIMSTHGISTVYQAIK